MIEAGSQLGITGRKWITRPISTAPSAPGLVRLPDRAGKRALPLNPPPHLMPKHGPVHQRCRAPPIQTGNRAVT